jgi:outer membrane murein-binding lipoprotein Lpp
VLSLQGEHIDIREIHSIGQMGSNISEADVRNAIAGNQNSVPPFFKGNSKSSSLFTGDVVGAKHRLKGIPTYGFWGKPGSVDGYRYQALNQLDRIVASIHTDLASKVHNSEMCGFLRAMLNRSSEFVRALFKYITNSYAELIETFTDSAQTWDFVCHCVEHIFSHEFNVARSILRGHDLKSQGFNERMLWTSLRNVVVQESFLAVGIANHSSLSGAYSKFLLKNSQSSEVVVMKRKLENMEVKVEALNAKVAKFDTRIKAAEGTANKAANEATKKKT